jgi:hypothetical protein
MTEHKLGDVVDILSDLGRHLECVRMAVSSLDQLRADPIMTVIIRRPRKSKRRSHSCKNAMPPRHDTARRPREVRLSTVSSHTDLPESMADDNLITRVQKRGKPMTMKLTTRTAPPAAVAGINPNYWPPPRNSTKRRRFAENCNGR